MAGATEGTKSHSEAEHVPEVLGRPPPPRGAPDVRTFDCLHPAARCGATSDFRAAGGNQLRQQRRRALASLRTCRPTPIRRVVSDDARVGTESEEPYGYTDQGRRDRRRQWMPRLQRSATVPASPHRSGTTTPTGSCVVRNPGRRTTGHCSESQRRSADGPAVAAHRHPRPAPAAIRRSRRTRVTVHDLRLPAARSRSPLESRSPSSAGRCGTPRDHTSSSAGATGSSADPSSRPGYPVARNGPRLASSCREPAPAAALLPPIHPG